jgi:hypothetical protein
MILINSKACHVTYIRMMALLVNQCYIIDNMLGEARTGARARASPSMLSKCLFPFGTSTSGVNFV